MNIDINLIQTQYEGFFDKVIYRKDQVLKFKDFLEKETNWLTAPASTRMYRQTKIPVGMVAPDSRNSHQHFSVLGKFREGFEWLRK